MADLRARLSALLADARNQARATRKGVLVSVTERISAIDPLEALELMARMTAGRALTGDAADRMYWARPTDDFALAGFGSVVILSDQGAERFATIDRQWAALRQTALIDDPSGDAPGVGPLLMGGFAFDPDGPQTDRWRDFPAARLILPRVQLASHGREHWLTLNLLVASDGEPDVDPGMLLALRNRIADGQAFAGQPVAHLSKREALESVDVRSAFAWRASVAAAVAAIRGGAFEKVVLAREVRVTAPRDLDVAATLRQLRSAHQASFVFGCWHGDSAFVGASPELLVGAEGREVRASSLAGSAPRGATADDDDALAAHLLASGKDRAEHEIVRRAICAGLAIFCDDVVARDEPSLLSLPQVHHLHTDVRARLREGHTLLQLVAQLHPTPAVGGAPRDEALDFIREHEQLDRGWYAAPIGWLQQGRGEFAVALRSALITANEARLFAGSGIVADSEPDEEYAESQLKLRPMEMALSGSVVARDKSRPMRAAASTGGGR
jgi:isochorismate synthase